MIRLIAVVAAAVCGYLAHNSALMEHADLFAGRPPSQFTIGLGFAALVAVAVALFGGSKAAKSSGKKAKAKANA